MIGQKRKFPELLNQSDSVNQELFIALDSDMENSDEEREERVWLINEESVESNTILNLDSTTPKEAEDEKKNEEAFPSHLSIFGRSPKKLRTAGEHIIQLAPRSLYPTPSP